MELSNSIKKKIDDMNLEQLLSHNRFAPMGDPLCQGESGDYLLKRLSKLKSEHPDEFVEISKRIGW